MFGGWLRARLRANNPIPPRDEEVRMMSSRVSSHLLPLPHRYGYCVIPGIAVQVNGFLCFALVPQTVNARCSNARAMIYSSCQSVTLEIRGQCRSAPSISVVLIVSHVAPSTGLLFSVVRRTICIFFRSSRLSLKTRETAVSHKFWINTLFTVTFFYCSVFESHS